MGIGGVWEIVYMPVLSYVGADPTTIGAIEAYNAYFSLTFSMGMIAYLFTMVVTLISRS